jgi:hypothetical protein
MARVLLLIDNNNPFPTDLENVLNRKGYEVQTYNLSNHLDFGYGPLYNADICVVSLPASQNTLFVSGWMLGKEIKVVAYASKQIPNNGLSKILEGVSYSSLELAGLIKNTLTKSMKPVDLGLSVLWADRNLGAQSIEDFGLYVRWNRINKRTWILEDYKGNRVSIPRGWRVPTDDELCELIKECEIEDVFSNHETKVVGQNGESIILKYGAWYDVQGDIAPDETNDCGFFLSSSSNYKGNLYSLYMGYPFGRYECWVRDNWNDESFINVRLVKDR